MHRTRTSCTARPGRPGRTPTRWRRSLAAAAALALPLSVAACNDLETDDPGVSEEGDPEQDQEGTGVDGGTGEDDTHSDDE